MKRIIIWGMVFLIVLGGVFFLHWGSKPQDATPDRLVDSPLFRGGTLVIAGGGSLPDEVRKTFIELAGGEKARLLIIPAYEPTQDQIESMQKRWAAFQPSSVQVCAAKSRKEAESAEFVAKLADATGIWFSGGKQTALAQVYVGGPVEEALQELLSRGGVIGGSSAGAAIMSKCMIEQGVEEAQLGVGFDLLPDVVIDQHFLRRNRLQRLAGVLVERPHLMGLGIDEETALVVQAEKGNLAVVGNSYALAIIASADGLPPRYEVMKPGDRITMAGLRSGENRPISISDIQAILDE